MKNQSLFSHENKIPLSVKVDVDEFTEEACRAFDYTFDGTTVFESWGKLDVPKDFGIGLIVGSSGSGKSTLLKTFGEEFCPNWLPNKAIVSHFSTPEDAIDKLGSVGLNSIPTWCKPYHVLSTGEKFRASLARKIQNNAVIDEFTSVVDRKVAIAASCALRKYVNKHKITGIVIASCHRDIIEWLQPDWMFDTDTGELSVGRFLRRPPITIKIYSASTDYWPIFAKHHYLTGEINKSARCFIGLWDEELVAFGTSLAFPSGTVKNGWKEHRTVVLPDYQGIGLGVRFSDAIGQIHIEEGKKYFSKTAHPRMGEYRNKSKLWVPTMQNMVARKESDNHKNKYNALDKSFRVDVMCYSHEYIGDGTKQNLQPKDDQDLQQEFEF